LKEFELLFEVRGASLFKVE